MRGGGRIGGRRERGKRESEEGARRRERGRYDLPLFLTFRLREFSGHLVSLACPSISIPP